MAISDPQMPRAENAEEDESLRATSSLADADVKPSPAFQYYPSCALKLTENQEHNDDIDSRSNDNYEGSTRYYGSVSDSIYQYPLENGRTYHAVRCRTDICCRDVNLCLMCAVFRRQYVSHISLLLMLHGAMLLTKCRILRPE